MVASDSENRPRTRQRRYKPAPPLQVPDIEENAAERKRVLNILAQRRYRQRKRQLRQVSSTVSGQDEDDAVTVSRSYNDNVPESTDQHQSATKPASYLGDSVNNANGDIVTLPARMERDAHAAGHQPPYDPSLNIGGLSPFSRAIESLPIDVSGFVTDTSYSSGDTSDITFDLLATTFMPSDFGFGASHTTDASESSSTTANPSTTPSLTHSPGSSQLTSGPPFNSMSSSPTESFPDSYLLPMSELTLLRALLRIATRLNAHTVWDIAANSPFCKAYDNSQDTTTPASTASWISTLPAAWQPTTLQTTTPHHPLIDLLPWPAVRDKMIGMLSLPASRASSSNLESVSEAEQQQEEEAAALPKPEIIQQNEDTGIPPLVGFVYDMEDGAEGIRIWGGDPYDGDSWEVGQVLFQRWWFVFDRAVVERSNYWRRLRGAEPLRMGI